MKIATWNVNGLRAILKKGLIDKLTDLDADVIGLQETKLQEHQVTEEMIPPGYDAYFAYAKKKGYSGVVTYTRIKPDDVLIGMGIEEFDDEGRVVISRFKDLMYFNVYFPNSGMGPHRLDYKLRFYKELFNIAWDMYQKGLYVVVGGDYNTAHRPIDLKNPKRNEKNPGFLPEERAVIDELLNQGWIDVFRKLYPDKVQYTWWDYRFKSRERNVGWRIDYFLVSPNLMPLVKDCIIRDDVMGSDHCPVILDLDY